MQNQTQNLNQNLNSEQNQNQPPKKEPFSFISVKTLLAILIFMALTAVIIGGWVYVIGNYGKSETDNLIIPAVSETQCKINSDCELVYVGQSCLPCDTSDEEYKCLSLNEVSKIWEKRQRIFYDSNIDCLLCTEKSQHICKCANGKCQKVKEELIKEDCAKAGEVVYASHIVANKPSTCCDNEMGIKSLRRLLPNGLCQIDIPLDGAIGRCVLKDKESYIWGACGNGICNEEENKCNCLEDCGNKIDTSDLSSKASATDDWQIYRNEEFGFEIDLSEPWKGYKIFKELWNGTTLDVSAVKYDGSKVVIRNSKWSEDEIWQDIPILVFTKDEWQLIEDNNLNISATPIAPRKIGENNNYVFALLPRWIGFTNALGQNEARKIVETFKAFDLDETLGWQTYRNEEFGFEVKYPKEWILEGDMLYSLGMYNSKEGGPYSLLIQVDNSIADLNYFLNKKEKCIDSEVNLLEEDKNIVKFKDICAYKNPLIFAMIEKKKLIKGTSYSFLDESEVISQILSTFKFID
ncbi:hypothetical protein KAI65_01975 [Candidatus Parcubacteria bacterium]|nr:hypothetical protein [Candidatus Parcubacteria bacterium]